MTQSLLVARGGCLYQVCMDRLVILRIGLGLVLLVSVVALLPFSIAAQTTTDERPLGDSGLPLPRFVSVSKGEANVRRGPGADYPLYTNIAAAACHWKSLPNMANGDKCATMRALKAGCMPDCCAAIVRPWCAKRPMR